MKSDKCRLLLFLVLIILPLVWIISCISIKSPPPEQNEPVTAPVQPQIKPPTIVVFEVNPTKVTAVEPVTLLWEVTEATGVTIEPDIGQVPSSGAKKLIPSRSVVYTLNATNSGGSVTRTTAVSVYENVYASKIALTEEDVKAATFVYSQNSEPKIDDTISTYYIKFVRPGYKRDEILDNTVLIYNTVAAAEKRYIETKFNAKTTLSGIITIGDEGYIVKFPGTEDTDPATHIMRFRKNNVYVNVGTLYNYEELESFSRIVESRIR